MNPKVKVVNEIQQEFLKGLLCLWWDIPHTDKSYNESVRIVNKLLHRGSFKTGSTDEKAIKHLMKFYEKFC